MAIVLLVAGVVQLVCWVATIVKAFQSGSTSSGVLSICPLAGFILGWVNVKDWNHQSVMIAWTIATVLGGVIKVLAAGGAQAVAP